jgi:hypothetical protein
MALISGIAPALLILHDQISGLKFMITGLMSKWKQVSLWHHSFLFVSRLQAKVSYIIFQVREYVTTSLWGGLASVVSPRRISRLAELTNPAYAEVLWFFQGGRPLPVSLTIDDAPGDTTAAKMRAVARHVASWGM